ncbi:MAG: glycosyltransferase family 4 protein, partial [Planctomycetota bacterium]|nr:glycosyltransferase family 4 protein [Planctomycetota bacterium]
MKIVYLTAGAAGMYCGSCMHDNALARAMTVAGADVELVPTYTPIRTDEDDFSVDQVFFGGINVYLQQKIPLLRWIPKVFDRFLDNRWLIQKVTQNASNVAPNELGKLAYSMLKGTQGNQKKEIRRLVHWLGTKSRPDVVVFSNVLIGGCIPTIRKELGIDCFVTLQGDDIFLDSLPEKYKALCIDEIRKLDSDVKQYIVHSQFYADFMSDLFSIEKRRISVTPLGIQTDGFSKRKSVEGRPPTIGYLARIAPEKGLHILVDAFIKLRQSGLVPGVKLKIAGWLGPAHESYANQQFDKLCTAGLKSDFEFERSIGRDSKVKFLNSLD